MAISGKLWQRASCYAKARRPDAFILQENSLDVITSFFIKQVTLQQNVINKKRIASVEKQHERKKRRLRELIKNMQLKLSIESCLKQKPIIMSEPS